MGSTLELVVFSEGMWKVFAIPSY